MTNRTTGKLTSVVAVGGALALATAGCGSQGGGGSDSGKSSDPETAVTEAMKALEESPYEATMTVGDMANGEFAVDTANKQQQGTMSLDGSAMGEEGMAMDMEFIAIDKDYWMKMSGDAMSGAPIDEDQWIHMNLEEVGEMGQLDMDEATQQMLDSIENIEEKDDNTYTATMNLDAVEENFGGGAGGGMGMPGGPGAEEPGEPGQEPGEDDPMGGAPGDDQEGSEETQEGEEGQEDEGSVEVTLTLDDNGQLQKLEFDAPGVEEEDMTVSMEITNHDAKVDVEAPSDEEVVEYEELTGGGSGMTP